MIGIQWAKTPVDFNPEKRLRRPCSEWWHSLALARAKKGSTCISGNPTYSMSRGLGSDLVSLVPCLGDLICVVGVKKKVEKNAS